MEFFDKIRDRIQDLEEKEFYRYLLILFLVLILLMGFFIFRFYRNVNSYKNRIEEIEDIREDSVKDILARNENVQKRRKEVNAILEKEEGFKIIEYFEKLLQQLGLGKAAEIVPIRRSLGQLKYDESEITARLTGISTQGLCMLLEKLEQNKRINIKELEIKKSEKTPKAIDVTIKIATLQPKVEEVT